MRTYQSTMFAMPCTPVERVLYMCELRCFARLVVICRERVGSIQDDAARYLCRPDATVFRGTDPSSTELGRCSGENVLTANL